MTRVVDAAARPAPRRAPRVAGALLAAALALFGAPARAQPAPPTDAAPARAPFSVVARVEPDPVAFAAPFDLVVEVVRGRAERLVLPREIPDTKGARRAGDVVRSVVESPDGSVKEIVRVPFLALDVDDVQTPAFVITAPDGSPLDVPALPVRVEGAPPAPPAPEGKLDLVPAKPSMTYEVLDARPLVALGALATSGLSYALLAAVVRRRRFAAPPAPVVVPPPRPPHVVALERLEALLRSGLLARGEIAPFVAQLMDEVLRDYLQARFGVHAGTQTTRELVEDLLARSAPGLDVATVRALLEGADLVKFARAELAADEAHRMAVRVRAIIEATAPKAAPVAAPEAAR